jgi:hypothetical protein
MGTSPGDVFVSLDVHAPCAPESEAVTKQARFMIDRRSFLLGVAGASLTGDMPLTMAQQLQSAASVLVTTPQDVGLADVTREVLVGDPLLSVRVTLGPGQSAALEGIGSPLLHPPAGTPLLSLELHHASARLRWEPTQQECVISLRNGCEHFVTGWALPLFRHGPVGFDPGQDVPLLFAAGAGEYWWRVEGEELPAALGRATSVYACFFGNYDEDTLFRIDAAATAVSAHLAPGANFIFNAIIDPAHSPAMLITGFGC